MRWPLTALLFFFVATSQGRASHHPRKHHYGLSSRQPESVLLDDMMRRYDRRCRPELSTARPAVIHMSIVLAILTEIRENEQVASIVISHVQRWRDDKLSWDPSRYNGTTQLIIPVSLIWMPKLVIYNSMDTKPMLSEERYDARVSYTGDIKVNNPEYVTVICRLNIDLFPFDTQFCAIAFASPLLNMDEMQVNVTAPPIDSYFAGNAEWEVMNVSAHQLSFLEDGEFRAEVHYILHLNRRPIYYVTVIVVPTFLISALSILGIFSPGSNEGPRNEKVSLGLGSLLAMTVLLDIVAGAMPKSNSIPLLGYYIITEIMICAIGVAISMALLSASKARIQTERLPPESTYRILHLLVSPKCYDVIRCMGDDCKSNGVHHTITGGGEKEHMLRIPELASIATQMADVAAAQRAHKERLQKIKWNSKVEREWNRIFSRIDHLLLLLFELLNLCTLVGFLRYAFLPVPPLPDNFSV